MAKKYMFVADAFEIYIIDQPSYYRLTLWFSTNWNLMNWFFPFWRNSSNRTFLVHFQEKITYFFDFEMKGFVCFWSNMHKLIKLRTRYWNFGFEIWQNKIWNRMIVGLNKDHKNLIWIFDKCYSTFFKVQIQ